MRYLHSPYDAEALMRQESYFHTTAADALTSCVAKIPTAIPDNKVHEDEVNMGPIWGRQDPGGPHVGPINFAIWDGIDCVV